ncbi:RluA family pseudouridine synthase [Lactovum odontotermitis]
MKFSYTADVDAQKVKNFLKRQGVSKKLLAKVKFAGGEILVNSREENAIFRLTAGDTVTIHTPPEPANPELIPEDFLLDIVYEDEDYLIINKPAGYPSITGVKKPTGSMCNFAAAYLQRQNYENQCVHLVTRLDTDTSGLMIFAKHSFAHAVLSARPKDFVKRYYALVKYDDKLPAHGEIDVPIGRAEGSIIERRVRFDGLLEAKAARTSFDVLSVHNGIALLDLTLHTGRTHQIRVHMAYLGYPLLGDDLYGGDCSLIQRQALHCHYVEFMNVFTKQMLRVESELPPDLKNLIK